MIRISRISMRNFKSFRRVSIPIRQGFTAIVGPNGSGKCVHGNSKVLLSNGRMEKIEEIVEEAIRNSKKVEKLDDGIVALDNPSKVAILSLNPRTLRVETRKVTAFVKRKAPPYMLRIKTRTGREILTTHYHPFFTLQEGRIQQLRADELKVGRRIALPRRILGEWKDTALEPRTMLSRFSVEDNVYVPCSYELRNCLTVLERKFGGRRGLAAAAGISLTIIRSVHDGQAINVSNLYRILEAAEWDGYKLSELKSKGHGRIRVPESLDNGLARFLGYLVSEGRSTSSNQIWFVNADEEINADFHGLARELFGVEAKEFSYKGKTKDTLIFSHALCIFMDKIFQVRIGERSSEKKVPELLFSAPNDVVQGFLSALFAGDAYFCLRRRGKKILAYMEYSTASHGLAEDVAALLLRFGIPSIIRNKTKCASNTRNRTERTYHSVFVYGLGNLKRLAENLRIVGSKKGKLEGIKELSYRHNPNIDLIPDVNSLVKEAVRAAGISIKKIRGICPKLAAYYENRCHASREGILEVARTIEKHGKMTPKVRVFLEQLRILSSSDVIWDEIKELEKVDPPEWVYDLSIEGNHNFIANGIFVHNSNIIDGLCFVLGRSSAKSLRAERFSDLIFHGGKGEEPAKEAEVALYLDNSGRELPVEEKEVKISRTVDLEGNGDYRLNGRKCTRAEILELLAHAKIMPDGHNIVLQGDVTHIVEMNPIERRGLIDEIAGIAEYDEKKRKALRELEKVSDNMAKAEAVLGEVGGNLEKLSTDRDAALRHGDLRKELRRSKALLLHSKRLELSEKAGELSEAIEEGDAEIGRIDRISRVLALKADVKRKELEKIGFGIASLEEGERFQFFREAEKLRNEIQRLAEKGGEMEGTLGPLSGEYAKAKAAILESKKLIRGREVENSDLKEEMKRLEIEIKKYKEGIRVAYEDAARDDGSKGKLGEVAGKLEEGAREQLVVEGEINLLVERLYEKKKSLGEGEGELSELKSRHTGLGDEHQAVVKRTRDIAREMEECAHKKKRAMEEIVEVGREIEKCEGFLEVKEKELERLRAKSEAMEEMRLGPHSKAIEEVLKLKEAGKKGIHGTISELGKVDAKYSKALSAAAGRALEFIVVDDEDVAEGCILHLKEKKAGRATFLPLNKLKIVKPEEEQVALAKRAHGFALELVDYDPKLGAAFAYVFGNTIVVDDIAFAKKAGIGRARMVTLDGDLLETSGAMTGGHYQPNSGFAKADEAKERMEKLAREVEKLQRERSQLRKREEGLKTELEEIATRNHDLEKESSALGERLKSMDAGLEELARAIAENEAMARGLMSQIKGLQEALESARKRAGEVSAALEKLRSEKEALEGEFGGSLEERVLGEIKSLESELLEKERAKEEKRGRISLNELEISRILRPRFLESKQRLLEVFRERKRIKEALAAFDAKNAELKASLSDLEKKERGVSEEIERMKQRRDFFIRGISMMEKRRQELQEREFEIRRGLEECRVEKARVEAHLEEVMKGLKEFEGEEVGITDPLDAAKLERAISRMEAELEELGAINMRALEDYDAVKAKFDALAGKANTLNEEKQAILALMAEIEERKKSIFMEAFEHIALNFRGIFNRLSSGGEADLLLEDENPLDGGLHIRAKPVGKNPQYIELLSGGEKSLTALSLIFAIQRYQPAPFYVMDEIDMHLDDENLKRISELIKESARGNQFVVVSLRDSLMASADQLFGAVNEEGVSKIIGVELQEVGDTPN